MGRLCLFSKLLSTGQPSRIDYLLPQIRNSHRDPSTFHVFPSTTKCFKSSLFPHAINEWNKLDPNILSFSNYSNYNTFRNALLKFTRPFESKIFNINSFQIKLLTGLRLRISHLREHKFRNGFKDSLNAFCLCSIDAETTTLFPALLFCVEVSIFGVILVRIFPHSDWITPNTDTFFAVWMTWKIFPFLLHG